MINGSHPFLKADWMFTVLAAAAAAEHQEAMSLINSDEVSYFYKDVNYAFVSKCEKENKKQQQKRLNHLKNPLNCFP